MLITPTLTVTLTDELLSTPGAMPQVKKSSRKGQHFAVSPWQTKLPEGEPGLDHFYQETQIPFQPDPDQSAGSSSRKAQGHRAAPQVGQWKSRKRQALSDAPDASDALESAAEFTSPIVGAVGHSSQSDEDEAGPSVLSQPDTLLQGTAVLAFLPNGHLSGKPNLAQFISLVNYHCPHQSYYDTHRGKTQHNALSPCCMFC